MQVTVIGGTGHIGSYLVPRLVEAGHRLRVVSRGERSPYVPHGVWGHVEFLKLDRGVQESAGTFGERIAAARPDIVIDLTCSGKCRSLGGKLARPRGPFPALRNHLGPWTGGGSADDRRSAAEALWRLRLSQGSNRSIPVG